MRLGILPLGLVSTMTVPVTFHLPEFVAALRAADVDVVLAGDGDEHPPRGSLAVAREAERLQRADCDGVLALGVGTDVFPHALQVALRLPGMPLLAAGNFSNALFEAVAAFEEVGAWYERLVLSASGRLTDATGRVSDWLRENERRERQRGLEAAQRLYGQRCAVLGTLPEGQGIDPARWLTRFGVSVVHIGEAEVAAFLAGETRKAKTPDVVVVRERVDGLFRDLAIDFSVLGDAVGGAGPTLRALLAPDGAEAFDTPDGDARAAIVAQLLRLVSGSPIGNYPAGRWLFERHDGQAITLVAPYRKAGRDGAVLLRGVFANGRPYVHAQPETLGAVLASGRLYFASGEHVGAMRAACYALDIESSKI